MATRGMKRAIGASALAVAALVAFPLAAAADPTTTGTATITAGDLTVTNPSSINFAATLNGRDQTVDADQGLDVHDNTGSGAGWSLSLAVTPFTSGSDTLGAQAVSATSPANAGCDAGASCTAADNSDTTYPVLPDSQGTVILQAAPGSGMGSQTWTAHMHLAVPATAKAGSYASDWTYTIASGPA